MSIHPQTTKRRRGKRILGTYGKLKTKIKSNLRRSSRGKMREVQVHVWGVRARFATYLLWLFLISVWNTLQQNTEVPICVQCTWLRDTSFGDKSWQLSLNRASFWRRFWESRRKYFKNSWREGALRTTIFTTKRDTTNVVQLKLWMV